MILFDLKCGNGHTFEAWFRHGDSYEEQAAGAKISCPLCGDDEISKAPMAPSVRRAGSGEKTDEAVRTMKVLRGLRHHVEKNFDNVGERFPEEARKIHYGEVEKRNIYGQATVDEARGLDSEGIDFGPLPWFPPHDS